MARDPVRTDDAAARIRLTADADCQNKDPARRRGRLFQCNAAFSVDRDLAVLIVEHPDIRFHVTGRGISDL